MTYAVTAYRAASSNAERATTLFEVFETLEEAQSRATTWLKDERVADVSVWQAHSTPKLVTSIQWENHNG